MRYIIILVLFAVSTVCWAAEKDPTSGYCMGINQQLPDKSFSDKIIHSIGQQMPPKEKMDKPVVITKINKYMMEKNWHIVWAEPINIESGVFLLFGKTENLEYIAVWGGVAFPEEESGVLKWLKDRAPTAPISLLKCAAHMITHGQD